MSNRSANISTGDLTVGSRLELRGRPVRVTSVLVNVETSDGLAMTVLPEELEPAGASRVADPNPGTENAKDVKSTGNTETGHIPAASGYATLEDFETRIREGLAELRGLSKQDR